MTPPANDRPELTAYALGEIEPGQAAEVHALLAALPATAAELEQIEAVTDALRHGAPPAHDRLTPEQRHAVLRPAHLPRPIGQSLGQPQQQHPVRRQAASRRQTAAPFFARLTRLAALIAVTGLAFLAGKHAADLGLANLAVSGGGDAGSVPAASVRSSTDPAEEGTPASAQPAQEIAAARDEGPRESTDSPVVSSASVADPLTSDEPATATQADSDQIALAAPSRPSPSGTALEADPAGPGGAETVVSSSPSAFPPTPSASAVAAVPPVKASASSLVPSFGHTIPGASDTFASASKRPVDQFVLRPAALRPPPVRADPAMQLASPAPQAGLDTPAGRDSSSNSGKGKTPDVYIHSWKAEVASCPWNDGHRLLRLVVQLPVDQPAAVARGAYPLQVTFDPNAVRHYRLLCERRLPAPELRSAGVQVVWYEFQPNGAVETQRDSGRPVAAVTLANGRFTTQTVGPFDGSKLQILDRGLAWENAREDFVFETAVVGFGMLLRGAKETGSLDHDLVLTLAEKGRGTDVNEDRTRFIRLVHNARKAAGL